jgi:thiosulfate/3-mercaptopyruvate sulfurtransferase
MPGSVSVPSADLVGPDGRLKPITELRAIFDKAGVDLDRPLITSCGSGVTAAVDMLALKLAGAKNLSLYDGAWAEWGSRKDTPILRD